MLFIFISCDEVSKKHNYELARKSFFAVLDKGDGGLQDFIHTPNFILVDTKKQIRGIYDGTVEKEISRLILDINILVDIWTELNSMSCKSTL